MDHQGVSAQIELARRYTRRLRRHLEAAAGHDRLDRTVDRLEGVLRRLELLVGAPQTKEAPRAVPHEGAPSTDGLLRQLAESNLLGVLSFRIDGTIDDANDYFLNLIGYSRADLEAGRLNWRRITPPECVAADERALEQVTRCGFCTPFEKEYIRADGGRAPVLLAGTLLQPDVGLAFVLDRSAQKRAHDQLLAARDELERRVQQRTAEITAANRSLRAEIEERQKVETRLEQVSTQMRAVLEASPDLHFRIGTHGEICEYYAHPATPLYTEPEGFLGRTLDEVLPADVAGLLRRAIDEVVATGAMQEVAYWLTMPGGAQYYETRIVPFRDREVLGIVRNVTARYAGEAALRESEDRFASAFHYAPIGMALVDLDGRPFQVNRALCEMLGYSEAELLQRSVRDVTHPDDMPDAYAHLQSLLAGEYPVYQLEKRYFHKDGHVLWGRLSASLVRDAAGAPRYVIIQVHDITAQRDAFEQLRQSEQRFFGAFHGAATGMALVGLDGRPLQINAALRDMLGYSEEESLSLPILDIMHPDDVEQALADRQRLVDGEVDRYESERRYLHKAGNVVWTQMSVSLVRDGEGRPLYLISHLVDITARKLTEQALRESEERFSLAVAGANDGLWDWHLAIGELYLSPRGREILGIAASGFDEHREQWDSRLHEDDRESVLAATWSHLSGDTPNLDTEYRIRQAGGGCRWVRVRGVCIRDDLGKPVRMAGSISDITERKMAEESLRDSEAMFQAFMRHCPAAAFLKDEDGRYLYINPVVERVFELPPDQWVGRTDSEIWPGRVSEGIRCNDVAVLESGQATEFIEKIVHADGEHRWLALKFPVRDARGRRVLAGMSVDVTEREQAKDLLRNAQQELEQRVRHRTAELAQANRLLREEIVQRRETEAALRESEQKFRATFHQAAVGIAQIGIDGRWRLVNQKLCDVLGYEREELMATTFCAVAHPHDVDDYVAVLRRLLVDESSSETMERQLVRKDGRLTWAGLLASVVRDSRSRDAYLVLVLKDISDRKRAEEERGQAELRYQRLVEQLPAITYVRSLESPSRTLYISPQVEAMLGVPPREWMEEADLWRRQIDPEDRDRVLSERGRSEASGARFSCEYRLRARDGHVVWVRDEATIICDGAERPLFCQGVMLDITERKRSAEELAALSTRLGNILEGIADGFLAVDRQGRLAYINPSGAKLLRIDRESSIGRDAEQVLPESLGTPFYDQYRKVMTERRPIDVEAYYPPLNRWIHARAYPSPEGMSVLFEDISERHAREVTTVSDILRALNAHVAITDAFPEVAVGIKLLAACDHSTVSLFDESCEWATVIALHRDRRTAGEHDRYPLAESPARADILAGQPHVVSDLALELEFNEVRAVYQAGYRSRVSLPLRHRDRVVGMLNLAWRRSGGFDAGLLPLLSQVADALALAVEKSRLFEEVRGNQGRLRALSQRLMEVQETERRLLASELHDEIGQTLTALRLVLDAVDRVAPRTLQPRLDDAQHLTDDLMERVRRLSLDLRPAMLDDLGLLPALLWLFDRYTVQTGVHVEFAHNGLSRRFSSDVETAAFRIVQEALTNVARHAEVPRVTVHVWADPDNLGVQIKDEGSGFDADVAVSRGTSSGLAGMRERVVLLGGIFSIESVPGRGACVSAHLPLRPVADELGR